MAGGNDTISTFGWIQDFANTTGNEVYCAGEMTVRGGTGNDAITLRGFFDIDTGEDTRHRAFGDDGDDWFEMDFWGHRVTGGTGADTFKFIDMHAPGAYQGIEFPLPTAWITDFTSGADKIDLTGFSPQGFSFTPGVVAAFTGVAGQLRAISGALLGDVDGDKIADLRINLGAGNIVTDSDLIL